MQSQGVSGGAAGAFCLWQQNSTPTSLQCYSQLSWLITRRKSHSLFLPEWQGCKPSIPAPDFSHSNTCLVGLAVELSLGLRPVFPFTFLMLLDVSTNITDSQPAYLLEISRPCLNVELLGGTKRTASWLGVPYVSPPNTCLSNSSANEAIYRTNRTGSGQGD